MKPIAWLLAAVISLPAFADSASVLSLLLFVTA